MPLEPGWPNNGVTTSHPEPPPIDDRLSARLDSLRKSFRRSLADQIEAVFREACLTGDFDVAQGLLATLEFMHTRAEHDVEARPRGRPEIAIDALRAELAETRANPSDMGLRSC